MYRHLQQIEGKKKGGGEEGHARGETADPNRPFGARHKEKVKRK
jgi:hypothetical protein